MFKHNLLHLGRITKYCDVPQEEEYNLSCLVMINGFKSRITRLVHA